MLSFRQFREAYDPNEPREPKGKREGGRWTKSHDSQTIEEIRKIIDDGEYEHYGLRVYRGDSVNVGDTLHNSYVWVDGKQTEEELNGVSSLEVKSNNIERILEKLGQYKWGESGIILVGGDIREWGEDEGEIIIRKARCLARIDKE